jgi:bifunctional non-homologous end joining protein LigD
MAKSVARSRRQSSLYSDAAAIARDLPGIQSRPFPKFIEPALAELRPKPPSGEKWVHEIKFDGYRMQLHKRDAANRAYTRRGYDWSDRFRHIIASLGELNANTVVLDGEVIVPTPEGRSDFAALESDLSSKNPSTRLVYYAFDILHLGTSDLRACTLLDRKRVLHALLDGVKGPIKYSEHLEDDGPHVLAHACEMELEGVVSKRVDGPYQSGRTTYWSKTTCRLRDTFYVAGWAQKNGKFDGIYLGRKEKGQFVYAGKLERGFSDDDKKRMIASFAKLKRKTQPIVASREFPKAQWIEPRMMVDAEFRGKTGEGLLRHPAFKGFRRDLE